MLSGCIYSYTLLLLSRFRSFGTTGASIGLFCLIDHTGHLVIQGFDFYSACVCLVLRAIFWSCILSHFASKEALTFFR